MLPSRKQQHIIDHYVKHTEFDPQKSRLIEIMAEAQELIEETSEPGLEICPECGCSFYAWDLENGTTLCYRCWLGMTE